VRELRMVVSCGGSGERRWRTELELGCRKSLDDHHRPTTLGTGPKRVGLLGVTRRALLPDCVHDNSHRDFHVVID